jgi:hypothetical protein
MTRPVWLLLLLLSPSLVVAEDFPREGPARLAAARRLLAGTVSKFEFTQGYDFRREPELLRPLMQAIKQRGFDTWDQSAGVPVWRDKEFAALERTLQVAGAVGLRVWATFCPPSESDEIARLPIAEQRQYYYTVVEQFARLAAKYPHFVAFTCDDFSYNDRLFTPEVLAEMARRWRAICPRLLFLPLLYYPGVSEQFFKTCGPYVDGIVFHFRAESYPPAVIPAYDAKNFAMYGDVMRYELQKVRQMAGGHPVVCGIYIWYYKEGWGVLTPDGKRPTTEHVVRDATQKIAIAHDFADGVRVYGLGIGHEAYGAMGQLAGRWRSAAEPWGAGRADPASHLKGWQTPPPNKPLLGSLLQSNRGLGCDLAQAAAWPRWEVLLDLEQERFRPDEAVSRYPLWVVSRTSMLPRWPQLMQEYARAGGVLAAEFLPGWSLDSRATTPAQPRERGGDRGILTLEMARLSGITFHHEPRGYATRWRVVKEHPLTKGLAKPGIWQLTVHASGASNYPFLAYPVQESGGEVLIEVEQEECPYDGRAYVRRGAIRGVYPLLTVNRLGRGFVVRHYAAVDPQAIFGKAYERLLANLLQFATGCHAAR